MKRRKNQRYRPQIEIQNYASVCPQNFKEKVGIRVTIQSKLTGVHDIQGMTVPIKR